MSRPTTKPLSTKTAERIRNGILGDVGYGKPPQHTRFTKGRSGNPSGRPPKTNRDAHLTPTADLILAEANRLIKIVENGEEREIPLKQAVLKAQLKSAMQGNSHAQERLLARIERAERVKAAQIESDNLLAKNYIERCRAESDARNANGMPEPRHFPHPNDVVFEPDGSYRILGPATEADAETYDHAERIRDLLFLQSLIAPLPGHEQISLELVTAFLIDHRLPPSLKRGDDGWLDLQLRVQRIPRRQLEKLIQHEWRDLGVDTPRGATLPLIDLDKVMHRISGHTRRTTSRNDTHPSLE